LTRLFADELFDEFGTWPLAYIGAGGADYGEIRAVAAAVGDGDAGAYWKAWCEAGDRLAAEADAALAKGHRWSARELYLRAAAFYGTSFHPLYGAPVDPRVLQAFGKQRAAFERGLALGPHPVAPLAIPFEATSLPAYLIPAAGREREVRPLVVLTNGYDGTIPDMYFASAVAASRRGYHALLFDGPGQGAMLYERGVPLRADWETVVAAAVDFALAQPIVDGRRIALSGWSLGGYLAPRAASAEHRPAAVIADPATWGIANGFRGVIRQSLKRPAEAVADLGKLDQAILDKTEAFLRADRSLYWKVMQRGFWVHGVDNLRDFFAAAELFTMDGRAELIRCPALLTMAEGDRLGAGAPAFFEALLCPKTLLRFTAVEGADGHCEMQNRPLLNRRALDWLDEVLGQG